MDERSLRPLDPTVPNDNDPLLNEPATVGPPTAVGGDPNGVVIVETEPAAPRLPPPRPMQWSGWPDEWQTPNWWNRLNDLADTAWACLDLNSALLSTMPPYLVGAAPSLPVSWLQNPNPDLYNDWCEFAKQLFWEYQLGEAFVVCTARTKDNYPSRFHVAPQWSVQVEMAGNGQRRYTIGNIDVTADILHIRYQSTVADARGHGPLEAGRSRLVAATVLTRYGTNLAAAGGIPYAILTHPEELTARQAADLQTAWIEARMSRLGMPAILSGGITFEALQLSPKDMALLELLQFNESRICVMLGVPPFIMALPSGGDSMTYSNVNMLFDYHWRASLRPKASSVMAALSNWLLPRTTRIELNRDSYVQREPYERAQTYEILNRIRDEFGRPVLTVEAIQHIERLDSQLNVNTGVMQ